MIKKLTSLDLNNFIPSIEYLFDSLGYQSKIMFLERTLNLAEIASNPELMKNATSNEIKKYIAYTAKNNARARHGGLNTIHLRKLLSEGPEYIMALLKSSSYIYDSLGYQSDIEDSYKDCPILGPELMEKLRDPEYRQYSKITSVNDVYLIDLIKSDSKLRELVQDRESLIQECEPIYQKKQVKRSFRNKINKLPWNYSERTPLKDFNNLDLLRIYLISNSLQDINNLKTIGGIIVEDLGLHDSELGGVIEYQDGKLVFVKKEPREELDEYEFKSNHYYAPSFNKSNYNGISTFHLHASSIKNKKTAGPSGNDLYTVSNHRATDVVVTPIGIDRKTGMLKVNFDFYLKDWRNNLRFDSDDDYKYAKIADLGMYLVPFK